METWDLSQLVFMVFVGSFSLTAAFCDFRARRIPNLLTVPMFLLGWVYQLYFFGSAGLQEGAMAFGLAFGTLFLIWMMGSGGGGDVKLMGALSVWLGLRTTILVMLFSTILVLAGTVLTIGLGLFKGGLSRTREKYIASTENGGRETVADRQQRRVMAFAIPVALATWVLMIVRVSPL